MAKDQPPQLPPGCDARENPAVCQLKTQRSDALDNLAVARGDIWATQEYWWKYISGEAAARVRTDSYWKQYVSGLHPPELAAHIKPVCAWRVPPNKPAAELCAWWRATQRSW